ncbi:MAG: thiamine diphosphokinase [Flavobacteriaceae bacterium]|jgi:thiamine pyrophosphokinase|nr:thiamine diphosphokinase [Flavobacteriaceae bacterium]
MSKALLFINGRKPEKIPADTELYSVITCTDGAYSRYVKELPLTVDYISGDLDSINPAHLPSSIQVIETPDQNSTDFHKALELLLERGITEVDVYGATGGEIDHFIGNLAIALFFKDKLRITFYDDYAKFFFSGKKTRLRNIKGKIVSLIPFFEAKNISTEGLQYPLRGESLVFTKRVGTRNMADKEEVSISYTEGELLIYIGR